MNEGFISFMATLGAGIVGGLILNIMPCVLPGLFMKARSVLMHLQSGQELKDQRADGLAYLLGSLSTFTVYGLIIIVLRTSGQSLGWGMQMQSPIFVGILLLMTFLFALSCFDLFEINLGINYSSSTYGPRLKSFIDGVFITLISTPCSAPILGGAVTVALASESTWWATLLLFWSIAIGLCLPILAISFFPSASKWVPRAGDWTESFKYFVGITLLGACVWLLTVYIQLIPSDFQDIPIYLAAVITTLFLLIQKNNQHRSFKTVILISLGLFTGTFLYTLYQGFVPKDQAPRALYALCALSGIYILVKNYFSREGLKIRQLSFSLSIIFTAIVIWYYTSEQSVVALIEMALLIQIPLVIVLSFITHTSWRYVVISFMTASMLSLGIIWASQSPIHHLKWVPYEDSKLSVHLKSGKPVFLDFTADWCISCKTFEGLYLNTPSTADLFERTGILPLQADLTTPESPLWGLLKEFKRDGIPAYVLYHPDGKKELLPEGPPLSLHDRVLILEKKLSR